ncbi:hypothetical protein FKP32DRAFT_1671383 [Trametes sanguinea]|nr:hypothetical protein FKP32DRAFT_1671383 [Trametes sanguinea]
MAFQRNRRALITEEFSRLASEKGWDKRSKEYKKKRKEFYASAVTEDFTAFWGANETRLSAWRDLCLCIGIKNVPSSIEECKKALQPIHVNLVDLVDSKRTGHPPRLFKTESDLGHYSRQTAKIFPKARAKANPLLRQFLIHIFS